MSDSSENSNLEGISESSSLSDSGVNVNKGDQQGLEVVTSVSKGSRLSQETDDSSTKYARKSSDTSAQSIQSISSDQLKPDSLTSTEKGKPSDETGIEEQSDCQRRDSTLSTGEKEESDCSKVISEDSKELKSRPENADTSIGGEKAFVDSVKDIPTCSNDQQNLRISSDIKQSKDSDYCPIVPSIRIESEENISSVVTGDDSSESLRCLDSTIFDVSDRKGKRKRSIEGSSQSETIKEKSCSFEESMDTSVTSPVSSELKDTEEELSRFHIEAVELQHAIVVEHEESPKHFATSYLPEVRIAAVTVDEDTNQSPCIDDVENVPESSSDHPSKRKRTESGSNEETQIENLKYSQKEGHGKTEDIADQVFEDVSEKSAQATDQSVPDLINNETVMSDSKSDKQENEILNARASVEMEEGDDIVHEKTSSEPKPSTSGYREYQEKIYRKYGIVDIPSDSSTGSDSNICTPTTYGSFESNPPSKSHTASSPSMIRDTKSSGKETSKDSGASSDSIQSANSSEGRALDQRNTWLVQAGTGPRVAEEVIPPKIDIPGVTEESAVIEDVSYRALRRMSTLSHIDELPEDSVSPPAGTPSEFSFAGSNIEIQIRSETKKEKSSFFASRESSIMEDSSSSGPLKYDASDECMSPKHAIQQVMSTPASELPSDEFLESVTTTTSQESIESTLVTTEKTEDYCEPTVQSDISELDMDETSSINSESLKEDLMSDKPVPLAVEECSDLDFQEVTPKADIKSPVLSKQSSDNSLIPSKSSDDYKQSTSPSKTDTPSLFSEEFCELNENRKTRIKPTVAKKTPAEGIKKELSQSTIPLTTPEENENLETPDKISDSINTPEMDDNQEIPCKAKSKVTICEGNGNQEQVDRAESPHTLPTGINTEEIRVESSSTKHEVIKIQEIIDFEKPQGDETQGKVDHTILTTGVEASEIQEMNKSIIPIIKSEGDNDQDMCDQSKVSFETTNEDKTHDFADHTKPTAAAFEKGKNQGNSDQAAIPTTPLEKNEHQEETDQAITSALEKNENQKDMDQKSVFASLVEGNENQQKMDQVSTDIKTTEEENDALVNQTDVPLTHAEGIQDIAAQDSIENLKMSPQTTMTMIIPEEQELLDQEVALSTAEGKSEITNEQIATQQLVDTKDAGNDSIEDEKMDID